MTTKRSARAKKVNASRSNAAKLAHARKKAKARMDQWVDEEQFVSLATAGVQFVGTLSRLGDDTNGHGDFMFKSAFGVSSLLFLLIFDQIAFEEIAGMPEHIRLSHSRLPDRNYMLERTDWMSPKAAMIDEVNQQLRLWTKLKTPLGMHFGDPLRVTAHRGLIAEPELGTFLFNAVDASTIHVIQTAASHVLEITRKDNRVAITMYNRTTNSYVVVSDASESPEAVFERFAALTRRIQ